MKRPERRAFESESPAKARQGFFIPARRARPPEMA